MHVSVQYAVKTCRIGRIWAALGFCYCEQIPWKEQQCVCLPLQTFWPTSPVLGTCFLGLCRSTHLSWIGLLGSVRPISSFRFPGQSVGLLLLLHRTVNWGYRSRSTLHHRSCMTQIRLILAAQAIVLSSVHCRLWSSSLTVMIEKCYSQHLWSKLPSLENLLRSYILKPRGHQKSFFKPYRSRSLWNSAPLLLYVCLCELIQTNFHQ